MGEGRDYCCALQLPGWRLPLLAPDWSCQQLSFPTFKCEWIEQRPDQMMPSKTMACSLAPAVGGTLYEPLWQESRSCCMAIFFFFHLPSVGKALRGSGTWALSLGVGVWELCLSYTPKGSTVLTHFLCSIVQKQIPRLEIPLCKQICCTALWDLS